MAMAMLSCAAVYGLMSQGALPQRRIDVAPTPPHSVGSPCLGAPLLAPAPAAASASRQVRMVLATAPEVPKTGRGGQRRSSGQLISWYFNSISSTRLLTADQEQQLSYMIIAGDEYERQRDTLGEELGREPTEAEWAEQVGLAVPELRKRMRRANSARDLMVAANMRLVVSIVRPYLQPNAVAGGALSMEGAPLSASPSRARPPPRAPTACRRHPPPAHLPRPPPPHSCLTLPLSPLQTWCRRVRWGC